MLKKMQALHAVPSGYIVPIFMSPFIVSSPFIIHNLISIGLLTRNPCYRKDDRAMHPIYKLFTLILFTLAATILCADFDSERI